MQRIASEIESSNFNNLIISEWRDKVDLDGWPALLAESICPL